MKITWLTLALLDLEQVRAFIRQDNPAAAVQVGHRLEAVVDHLGRYPEMGRPGQRPGIRELILPDLPFRIVYRVQGDAVHILRVYHMKRKWPSLPS